MINSIGGFFEMELRHGEHYHQNALKLNTARNCLEYLLRARNYKKIFIPYYTCEVILEPIKKIQIEYDFYHINQELEPVKDYKLLDHEAFLYINYFGLKQEAVVNLFNNYGTNLIVDNSQAFYAEPVNGIDAFFSARKFFGVPDGAYLYTNKYLKEDIEQDFSYMRMVHLLKRIDIGAELGYEDFKKDEALLNNQPIKKMSILTDKLLRSIDYNFIRQQRINNYKLLDKYLQTSNRLKLNFDELSVPMVYPYLSNNKNLKNELIQNKIFVATYWNNVLEWSDRDSIECELVENLLPLPIDQRYNSENMMQIVHLILDIYENK